LLQIAASQQGGSRGAQVWGVTKDYGLTSSYQETPGGTWSAWIPAPWVAGGPTSVLQVTACQQNDGRVQLWVTDQQQQLWSIWQTSPGGGWSAWSGPNWSGASKLTQICACQQGGARGAQFWGITNSDGLVSIFQETPGGGWSAWMAAPWVAGGPAAVVDVAAAQQNDGRVQLWVLDQQEQIWSIWQTSPGGGWTGWSGPNWGGSQTLNTLAASQQGGPRGAQLWATDQKNQVWSTYQETPGGGWALWLGPNWQGAAPFIQMAAAQQNNGCVQVWGLDQNLSLKSITQTSPGGGWSNWGP
jgi:hypothetical protein